MTPVADVYVRHAMPQRDPDQPPEQWHLGTEGRGGADDLSRRLTLPDPVVELVSSPEPKALETAAPLAERFGLEVTVDERLHEVGRPWVGDGYRAQAHRYLRGEAPEGWEDRAAVAARMAAAVADARARAGGGRLLVVGHGLALAVHVEANLPEGFDTCGFWSGLAFPDAWALDSGDAVLFRPLRR